MEAKLFPECDALFSFYMNKLLAEERLDAGLPVMINVTRWERV